MNLSIYMKGYYEEFSGFGLRKNKAKQSQSPAFGRYMFSRPLAFATIPKACGFEAATRFPSILSGGSLIPIVVYRDGDGFPPAKHLLWPEIRSTKL